jgi:uncharacterized protein (UPF0264 family)
MTIQQRLLVSVRGPNEAIAAAQGGAHIADVEYPASALGTPYPLNILAVREALTENGFSSVQLSTNIGEVQTNRPSSCQAALGVATAGAQLVKFGLATLPLEPAIYLGQTLIRTIKHWYPHVKCYPSVFVDEDLQRYFRPFQEGSDLAVQTAADGLLVDTFNKGMGKGLLDYCSLNEISNLTATLHTSAKEAWVAGSVTLDELSELWATGVDVICVRGAACKPGPGSERFGEVAKDLVANLVATIPPGDG